MAQFRFAAHWGLLLSFAVLFCLPIQAQGAPIIWTGPTITFSKSGADDPTLAANQDRLTDHVWITRGSSQGIYNIEQETGFDRPGLTSPIDTAWATSVVPANAGKTIAASNWQQLAFTDWTHSFGGPGFTLSTNITTKNAVVHLISDDIYLDLTFTNFDSTGDFAYVRSTPPAAAPTGDYNGNGFVDAADYVIWRKSFNQSVSVHGSGADGDSDGMIDAGDYTYWRQRFGNATGNGSGFVQATAVPEPVADILLLTLCATVWVVRRDR
ncbi:MAG TPA: dockerin type I domain-containing protein [Lacipirellulaceae bacterium]|nr:dockerin type I domain-containing protein [Lacipirellulaceae bacterium]